MYGKCSSDERELKDDFAHERTYGVASLNRHGGQARGWSLAVVVLSSSLLATIIVYGILENFSHRSGG